jgi:hypothetical protein
VLKRRAQVRRTTLPGGKHALVVLPNGTMQPVHEVEPLPTRPLSQLPAHDVMLHRAKGHLLVVPRTVGSVVVRLCVVAWLGLLQCAWSNLVMHGAHQQQARIAPVEDAHVE